jgi:hypothetical protein
MDERTPEMAAERSEARRRAIATRSHISVSLTEDARWFEPFLRDTLPKVLPGTITWDEVPDEQTNILIETPLRTHELAARVPNECLRVLISGEPYSLAALSAHDVILDTKDEVSGRPAGIPFVYVPFYVTSFYERRKNRPTDLLQTNNGGMADTRSTGKRSQFAAFLYNQCLPHREHFFDELSRYKQVDALGKCRHSTDSDGACLERPTTRDLYTDERTYLDDAVAQYRDYRFVVALESERHSDYITEKLVNAMLAGAIPIYWGAREVGAHFNEGSFIDVGAFENVGACVEHIARIDSDEALYRSMLMQPWLHDNRLNAYLDTSAIVADLRSLFTPPQTWRSRLSRAVTGRRTERNGS